MSYLVEILLPVTHTRRNRTNLDLVRDELTAKFGGVTLHLNLPAEGLWDDDGDIERPWWSSYRQELETRFRQEEILIRATEIQRL